MFHAIAHMNYEGETIVAYICGEDSKAIREWLMAPIPTERDVLYLKSVPSSVGKKMDSFQFSVGKWWLTRVVLTRNKMLTEEEFRTNAHALNRTGAIISCSIQVEDPVVFKLLGYQPDGYPNIVPMVEDSTRKIPAYTQIYTANLLQLAPVPMKNFQVLESLMFPFASSNEEVALYYQEYAARVQGSRPESEPVKRNLGISPSQDLNINSNTDLGLPSAASSSTNTRRTAGTFFPPEHLMIDTPNYEATGNMTTEYTPESITRSRTSTRSRPQPSLPRAPLARTTPVMRAPPMFARPTNTAAGASNSGWAPFRARSPVTIIIRNANTGRSVITNTSTNTVQGNRPAETATSQSLNEAEIPAADSGTRPGPQQDQNKKRKITFGPTTTDSFDPREPTANVTSTAGPSNTKRPRILDDSAILATGAALPDISLENITSEGDTSEDEETHHITILAEILPRKHQPVPVITLSSDSNLDSSNTLSNDSIGLLSPVEALTGSATSPEEGSMEEYSKSSDSGLPRSINTSSELDPQAETTARNTENTTDPGPESGSNPNSGNPSVTAQLNSSDDVFLINASDIIEIMEQSSQSTIIMDSNVTDSNITMEEGEIADDEREDTSTTNSNDSASAIIKEANLLADSASNSDKSGYESDSNKGRKAGQ